MFNMKFHKKMLEIDAAAETDRIVSALRKNVRLMRRYGAVLGISGGIDSSVVLALCVRAFGREKVVAIIMPEKDSDPESEQIARRLAGHFGVNPTLEVLTPILDGFGCYPRRDEAIRRVFPDYNSAAGYKAKIVLPQNLLDEGTLNVFTLVVITPYGNELRKQLPVREFLQIVAASNFKQRTRMSMLYYHAEVNNYAVIGTANKNEHDQGFFVKYGDGGVDIKAIGHLYKTQVYQLAEYLGVLKEIRMRPPTTDTYSAPCTQEEFFFRLPFELMDALWYAQEHRVPKADVAEGLGLSEMQVERAFDHLSQKSRATNYLRMPPLELA